MQRLKNKDLESLGIYSEISLDDNFPVALIILKANVDLSGGIIGITTFMPAQYVGYVIDLEAGSIRTMTSRTGGRFKKALKDNSIPNDEDTLSPAVKKMLKEEEKLPEIKVEPLPYPFRDEPKQTCKVCVRGL
ncbi:MAG: hypothetical protein WCD18_27655 [Thermosynechococcaceae cyanobacterium]